MSSKCQFRNLFWGFVYLALVAVIFINIPVTKTTRPLSTSGEQTQYAAEFNEHVADAIGVETIMAHQQVAALYEPRTETTLSQQHVNIRDQLPPATMDRFGNYVATLSNTGDGLQRFLISEWPIESPLSTTAMASRIEGCMSYRYFVHWPGSIGLLVLEDNIMRLYHWDCQFNPQLQTYELQQSQLSSLWLKRSVKLILERSKFSRVNLNEDAT